MPTARRFVVLDRDGTIIKEKHYLSAPDQVELIPGVATGLRQLLEMGVGMIIVSNQSGIGKGLFSESQLKLVHEHLKNLLNAEGVHLSGIYFCPHVPSDNCSCRKPAPGLVELAAHELGFVPQDCFVVGDQACDVELGRRINATTFLVRTGYGMQTVLESAIAPDYMVDTAGDIVSIIKAIGGVRGFQ
jgi:D-glycero-D-manno-heptose 1,7-bisphosphate phosphatase